MESILRFYLLALAQGREAFTRDARDVYLVKRPTRVLPATAGLFDDEDNEPDTEIIGLRGTDASELRTPAREEWEASPIRKRPGYPPYNRVVVGRSRVCDVVCPYTSISKVHAHIRLENFMPVAIVDEKSANGTFLNGRRLAPLEIAPLGIGDRLRLGDVDFEIVDASAFYDLLRAQM